MANEAFWEQLQALVARGGVGGGRRPGEEPPPKIDFPRLPVIRPTALPPSVFGQAGHVTPPDPRRMAAIARSPVLMALLLLQQQPWGGRRRDTGTEEGAGARQDKDAARLRAQQLFPTADEGWKSRQV